MSTSSGRFYRHFLTSLYWSTLFDHFENRLEAKIFASLTKRILLRMYLSICQFKDLFYNMSMLEKSWCKICDKYIMTWNFPYHPWYQPSSIAVRLDMEVSDWYQGRYGKCHVIISKHLYSETCLYWTCLVPTFVFAIDQFSAYTC